jgi:alkylated DNA repair protein (DNA oxidative demethylase)
MNLFDDADDDLPLAPGALKLGGFARDIDAALLAAVADIARDAPFRYLVTPGGLRMSVAMTNCGEAGWVSDRTGYRYEPCDPDGGQPWPAMPELFKDLAARAAAHAGFANFQPQACLVNRYVPGSKLSLHQDRDERNLAEPIVSVSLGLPAIFLWGGAKRAVRPHRVPLVHGDVVVWGGPSRLNFHGIDTLPQGVDPRTGALRYNLIFRRVR